MYLKVAKALGALLLLAGLLGAQQAKKEWKSREEYDDFQAFVKETDANKKIALINAWKQKYADSQYKKEGLTVLLQTYAQAGKYPELLGVTKEILAIDPLDVTSLYWYAWLPPKWNNSQPEFLNDAEANSKKLIDDGDKIFAADRMPPGVAADAWNKAKTDMQTMAYKTLAWIAVARKDNEKAETAIKKTLEKNPNDGEASYWLSSAIRGRKQPERSSEVLFHVCRAASLTPDKGGIADPQRKQIDEYFVRAYNSFHGQDDEGLKELRNLCSTNVMPPSGFTIETAMKRDNDRIEKFRKEFPQLAFWIELRKELTGAEGDAYFEKIKGALLPGKIGETQFTTLKGKLVKQTPAMNPKELVLMMDTTQKSFESGEVTLKLESAIKGKAEPGTEIEFEGVAAAISKDPFMLTFEVELDKLKGWPVPVVAAGPATPGTKKAGGAVKKGTTKKK